MYPVYIPSKGRYDNNPTARLCIKEGIPYFLVVEPQDAEHYIAEFGEDNCLVMPENDMGLSYARRFCKQHSIDNGDTWHWQIDDDMKGVMTRIDGKNVKTPAVEVMTEIEKFTDQYTNIGQVGLCHSLFAWSAKTEYGLNKQCPSFVLFRNDLDVWWRDFVPEDTDYSLQVLTLASPPGLFDQEPKQWCTVLFYKYMFDSAVQGQMKGGCTEERYQGDGRLLRIKNLQKYWPGCFTKTWKHDSWRVAPSRVWRSFEQRLIKNEDK